VTTVLFGFADEPARGLRGRWAKAAELVVLRGDRAVREVLAPGGGGTDGDTVHS
jgi:hypothetical protein